ncbi:hypothetical protein D3C77_402870 [compost metagenome]
MSMLTSREDTCSSREIWGNIGMSIEFPSVIINGIEARANKSPFLLSILWPPFNHDMYISVVEKLKYIPLFPVLGLDIGLALALLHKSAWFSNRVNVQQMHRSCTGRIEQFALRLLRIVNI